MCSSLSLSLSILSDFFDCGSQTQTHLFLLMNKDEYSFGKQVLNIEFPFKEMI